ncbi:ABC transporter permease [Candidatus Izemoplasma sp. B36]|uniref:ABC transporter permease n=1 Tax=Candidatus Izemoplasma sp. B36 TaxID=3242468 RepID=UPI003558C1C4
MRNFNFVDSSKKRDIEQIRESLTYWKDAWRRLKSNWVAMVGLIGVIFVILFGFVGPLLTPYTYYEQVTDFSYLPPSFEIYELGEDGYVFLNGDYRLLLVTEKGEIIERLDRVRLDTINRVYHYEYQGEDIAVDYSYRLYEPDGEIDFTVTYKGITSELPVKTVWNKTYLLGSDHLGRDILTRLMFGARISLTIAFAAATVNLLIGVGYGSISGFVGGTVDNIMMRIVDIINSIPLVIYVILLMVLLDKSNMWTIILALGSVYWVGMARLVRGQILSLKDQEFVLAAKVIGVSSGKIISRHLIPNALGPILVSLTMMIPSAIFTEAFLSFIGIGISAPEASWGTMANEAIQLMEKYPYQLLLPSLAIGITVLSFNFVGDGLRSALDPRLRKG